MDNQSVHLETPPRTEMPYDVRPRNRLGRGGGNHWQDRFHEHDEAMLG
jgi:hypothetical protein